MNKDLHCFGKNTIMTLCCQNWRIPYCLTKACKFHNFLLVTHSIFSDGWMKCPKILEPILHNPIQFILAPQQETNAQTDDIWLTTLPMSKSNWIQSHMQYKAAKFRFRNVHNKIICICRLTCSLFTYFYALAATQLFSVPQNGRQLYDYRKLQCSGKSQFQVRLHKSVF
jgi:hypothetical protein